jgi:hypothetical protein
MPQLTLEERFWAKVDKGDGAGCWLWTAAKLRTGYGAFQAGTFKKKNAVRAHRMAWILTYGEIPDDLCVLHRCDVRLCVRPDHLFLGTYADNNADMGAKGRANNSSDRHFGSNHGNAKLIESQVVEIRRRYALNSRYGAVAALAREFGVSRKTIHQVVLDRIWTHV